MRIAFITAGAAGTICGSCLRDNTLVRALRQLGHEALLVPTYTPIRTDDVDVSESRVFYGGINVYLQDRSWIFRHTPRLIDRLLDRPSLLRWVSRYAAKADYAKLGSLTISMLQGSLGHQKKELLRLAHWLRNEVKPEVVLMTNVLLSGLVPELKKSLGVPVLATLQGDDIFLDALPQPDRQRCMELIRQNCQNLDGLIATSHWYADYMSSYLGIQRDRMHVIPPGIALEHHGGPKIALPNARPVIGYFARIAPEKGLHNLIEAFIELRKTTQAPILRVSGWLGDQHRGYLNEQKNRLANAGLLQDFEHVEVIDIVAKSRFLRSLDVICVPTVYREPKGLYLLEAWANGVPAVLPNHGCFPELVHATGGGILVPPGDLRALALELGRLTSDSQLGSQIGARAKTVIGELYSASAMARSTITCLENYTRNPAGAVA